MCAALRQHFAELFAATTSGGDGVEGAVNFDAYLEGMPRLSGGDAVFCERPISTEEVEVGVLCEGGVAGAGWSALRAVLAHVRSVCSCLGGRLLQVATDWKHFQSRKPGSGYAAEKGPEQRGQHR